MNVGSRNIVVVIAALLAAVLLLVFAEAFRAY